MEILFDFELDGFNHDITHTLLSKSLESELRNFIKGRLSVFSEAMEIQENELGAFVLVTTLSEPKFHYGFIDYTDDLKDKMTASFTLDDWNYISNKLMEIASSFRN